MIIYYEKVVLCSLTKTSLTYISLQIIKFPWPVDISIPSIFQIVFRNVVINLFKCHTFLINKLRFYVLYPSNEKKNVGEPTHTHIYNKTIKVLLLMTLVNKLTIFTLPSFKFLALVWFVKSCYVMLAFYKHKAIKISIITWQTGEKPIIRNKAMYPKCWYYNITNILFLYLLETCSVRTSWRSKQVKQY